jgi:hypothetical protein
MRLGRLKMKSRGNYAEKMGVLVGQMRRDNYMVRSLVFNAPLYFCL